MKKFSIAILVLSLAVGLVFAVACGGDDDNDDEFLCEYDAVSELCQQAYDCCGQLRSWAIEQGYEMYEQVSCEPYICIVTPEERCQDMLTEAVDAELTYKVDFPDCS